MEIMYDNLLQDSKCLTKKCFFLRVQILNLNKEKVELEKLNDRHLNTIKNLHNTHSPLSVQQKIINEKLKQPSTQTTIPT